MKGWIIFKHSVLLVLRNWKEALQISLVPLVAVGLAFAFGLSGLASVDPEAMTMPDGGMAGRVLSVVVVAMIALTGIAVNWHRFVILEEYPKGWFPPLRFGLVLGYFGRSILVVLLLALVFIPIAVLAFPLFGNSAAAAGLVSVVGSLVGTYLFLRMATILPSGAVGKPITIGEAWHATGKDHNSIVMLVLVLVVANLVIQAVSATPVIGGLVGSLFSAIYALVNVSILTTLFGHYVEGRPID